MRPARSPSDIKGRPPGSQVRQRRVEQGHQLLVNLRSDAGAKYDVVFIVNKVSFPPSHEPLPGRGPDHWRCPQLTSMKPQGLLPSGALEYMGLVVPMKDVVVDRVFIGLAPTPVSRICVRARPGGQRPGLPQHQCYDCPGSGLVKEQAESVSTRSSLMPVRMA